MKETDTATDRRTRRDIHCPSCRWEGTEPVLRSTDAPTKCPICFARVVYPTSSGNADEDAAIVSEYYARFLVHAEVKRAMAKHPDWPTDPIHAFAIIAEEFGEAAKDVLQLSYEPDKTTTPPVSPTGSPTP